MAEAGGAQMRVIGKLVDPFDPDTMDWLTYECLLKKMLKLNGINDEARRKMHIMAMIGMKAFAELMHALDGKDEDNLSPEELLKLLRDRYAPKKLVQYTFEPTPVSLTDSTFLHA